MWMQWSSCTQLLHKEEVGWLVLSSAAFTSGKSHRYSFLGGWVFPRTSLDTEWRKISIPLTPGIEPGRPARSQEPRCFSYLAHFNYINIQILPIWNNKFILVYHHQRYCPRASPSLQAQEPRLQFCRRQAFHRKLWNLGCNSAEGRSSTANPGTKAAVLPGTE